MSLLTDQLQPFLGKRFPAALVAAFLLQSAGALFWAGSAAQRIGDIERAEAKAQAPSNASRCSKSRSPRSAPRSPASKTSSTSKNPRT